VIAACIVCTVGGLIALRAHLQQTWQMRPVRASGPPSVGRPQPRSTMHPGAVAAEAPWALSALPECVLQQSVWRARDVAGLRAHLPRGAQPVPAGSVLQYRNCTLRVRRDDAIITRGKDRFHIPPHSRFFSFDDELIFMRQNNAAELRTYRLSNLQ